MLQVVPAPQASPHMPQLPELLRRSKQPFGQAVCPLVGHAHSPLVQVWPDAQALPHEPQLRTSLLSVVSHPSASLLAVEQLANPVAQVIGLQAPRPSHRATDAWGAVVHAVVLGAAVWGKH
jgi:hypothetical protein